MRLFLILFLALVTPPLMASPLMAPPSMAEEAGGLEDIAPDEWREIVGGRSVTYHIGGVFWAREAYDPGSDAVVIRMADGSCLEGTWSWRGGEYCFAWRAEGTSCFRHVRNDGEILIIPVVDSLPTGDIQTVADIGDAPVNCGSGLTS